MKVVIVISSYLNKLSSYLLGHLIVICDYKYKYKDVNPIEVLWSLDQNDTKLKKW